MCADSSSAEKRESRRTGRETPHAFIDHSGALPCLSKRSPVRHCSPLRRRPDRDCHRCHSTLVDRPKCLQVSSQCYIRRCSSPQSSVKAMILLAVRDVVTTDWENTQCILHPSRVEHEQRSLARSYARSPLSHRTQFRFNRSYGEQTTLQRRTPTRDAFDGHWTKWRA